MFIMQNTVHEFRSYLHSEIRKLVIPSFLCSCTVLFCIYLYKYYAISFSSCFFFFMVILKDNFKFRLVFVTWPSFISTDKPSDKLQRLQKAYRGKKHTSQQPDFHTIGAKRATPVLTSTVCKVMQLKLRPLVRNNFPLFCYLKIKLTLNVILFESLAQATNKHGK